MDHDVPTERVIAAANLVADHWLRFTLALLMLVGIFSALLWAAVLRYRVRAWKRGMRLWRRLPIADPGAAPSSMRERVPDAAYLVLDLLAAFVIVVLSLSAFLWIADETGVDEALGSFDDQLAGRLALSLDGNTLRVFAWITHLGDAQVQWLLGGLVGLALLARRDRWMATLWMAAVGGNGLLTRILKAAFERARPLHEHGWASETGWSFPSGHASGSVAVYGMLAYLLVRLAPSIWHLPIALAGILIAVLVGISRIALQVHYFSDVLAGFVSGAAWLVTCVGVAEFVRSRRLAGR